MGWKTGVYQKLGYCSDLEEFDVRSTGTELIRLPVLFGDAKRQESVDILAFTTAHPPLSQNRSSRIIYLAREVGLSFHHPRVRLRSVRLTGSRF